MTTEHDALFKDQNLKSPSLPLGINLYSTCMGVPR